MATSEGYQYLTDRTVNVVELPSGAVTSTLPFTFDATSNRFGFHLSANGARVATSFKSPVAMPFGRAVVDLATGDVVLADTGFRPTPRMSPNGQLVAMTDYDPVDFKAPSTRIYSGAALVIAVTGTAVGWLDDNRLLVQEYKYSSVTSAYDYSSSKIYDATGALVALRHFPSSAGLVPPS